MTWIRDNISWRADSTRDRAYPFFTIVERARGDCDDFASFFCTAAEACGIFTSLVVFLGDAQDGTVEQGHVVPLVRIVEASAKTDAQFGSHGGMVRCPENGVDYYWLICDPQTGAPGMLGQKWRDKLAAGHGRIFHNPR